MVTVVCRWWVTGLGEKWAPIFVSGMKPGLTSGEEPTQLRRNELYCDLYCDSNRAYLCNLGASFSDFWKNKAKI